MKPPALTWLRIESAVIALAAIAMAARFGVNAWAALAVLVAPDLALAFYGLSSRAGALAYNVAHSYTLPVAAMALGVLAEAPPDLLGLGFVWLLHIAGDRALGYGLKGARFGETHLGPIGRGGDA